VTRRTIVLGVVTAALATGCGPYIDEVNTEHQSRMEPKLHELEAAAAFAKSTPSLTEDKSPPGKVNVVLADAWSAKGNAALLYAEDLSSFDELGLVYARVTYADLVQHCSAALHTEYAPWDPANPERTPSGETGTKMSRLYPLCENLEYLAIIRTLAFAKPHTGPDKTTASTPTDSGDAGADGGDAGIAANTSVVWTDFSGGYVKGELLLISVKNPALVGGVRFEAESSPTLDGTPTDIGLETNLSSQVLAALKATTKAVGNISWNE
jgi:hypothetical protein